LFQVKYIQIQKQAKKIKTQGLITLATYGVGMLVGFAVAGADNYKTLEEELIGKWFDSCRNCFCCLLLLPLLFNDKRNQI
jgi:hypothetical protein